MLNRNSMKRSSTNGDETGAAERRREEILRAALGRSCARYAATKVSDIAEVAGMSTAHVPLLERRRRSTWRSSRWATALLATWWAKRGRRALAFFEGAAAGIMAYLRSDLTMADMFALMSHALVNDDAPERVKAKPAGFDARPPPRSSVGDSGGHRPRGDPVAPSVAFWAAIQGIAEELKRCIWARRARKAWISRHREEEVHDMQRTDVSRKQRKGPGERALCRRASPSSGRRRFDGGREGARAASTSPCTRRTPSPAARPRAGAGAGAPFEGGMHC